MLGPNEVPRVARAAGRLSGRAVGAFAALRARAEAVAAASASSPLAETQRDLREGLHQLHAIRDEIRSGLSPFGVAAHMQHRGPSAAAADAGPSPPPLPPHARAPAQPWPARDPFVAVSAAALGRLPARRGGRAACGADLLEDALAEESLGREAARLAQLQPHELARERAEVAGRVQS